MKQYTQAALANKDTSLTDLYNYMISKVTDEEASLMSKNFMLFIKTGETARMSYPEIQNILKEV